MLCRPVIAADRCTMGISIQIIVYYERSVKSSFFGNLCRYAMKIFPSLKLTFFIFMPPGDTPALTASRKLDILLTWICHSALRADQRPSNDLLTLLRGSFFLFYEKWRNSYETYFFVPAFRVRDPVWMRFRCCESAIGRVHLHR